MAYYHADKMPPPNVSDPVYVDRKEAMVSKALLETPAQALTRRSQGSEVPNHYIPTAAVSGGNDTRPVAEARMPWGKELEKIQQHKPDN